MKLTCGRVISSIVILCMLLSPWIMVFDKASKLVYYVKSLIRSSEENIDVFIDDEYGELDNLESKMSLIDIKSMESQIEYISTKRSYIQSITGSYSPYWTNFILFDLRKRLCSFIEEAESRYEECIKYLKIERYNDTLCNYMELVTSNDQNGLGDLLRRIEKFVKRRKKPLRQDFVAHLNKYLMEPMDYCAQQHSIQQMVYEPYELLIRNEKIAFSAYRLLYRRLTRCFQGDYTHEMETVLDGIIRRIRKYRVSISEIIINLPRDVRRCEPRPYVLTDENFFDLEERNLSISSKEIRLSPSYNCVKTCSNFPGKFPCKNISSSNNMMNMVYCEPCEFVKFGLICHESDVITEEYNSQKAEKPLPHSIFTPSCCKPTVSVNKKWYIPESLDYNCYDCFCECKNPDVDMRWRYAISLRPQESNITENMVVTGIGFHMSNNPNGVRVIYPRIKVAKLSLEGLKEGFWKDVADLDDGLWPPGEAGIDYAILGKDANQSMIFSLNENKEKPGYVVTGVKFRLRFDPLRPSKYVGDMDKSLELVVRLTPYDFITGNLSASGSNYMDPDMESASKSNKDHQSELFPRTSSKTVSEKALAIGRGMKLDTIHRQYLGISRSYQLKNFRQTTILYFDLRQVDPVPALPLSKIELFYDVKHHNGGSLAFKVTTVNIADLMKSPYYENLNSI